MLCAKTNTPHSAIRNLGYIDPVLVSHTGVVIELCMLDQHWGCNLALLWRQRYILTTLTHCHACTLTIFAAIHVIGIVLLLIILSLVFISLGTQLIKLLVQLLLLIGRCYQFVS